MVDKPGGVVLLREASFHLDAVHLVLKHPITQSHLQWRTHTHKKKKRICVDVSVCVCSVCHYLVGNASLADEQQVL